MRKINENVIRGLFFLAGGAIGGLVSFYICSKRYEEKLNASLKDSNVRLKRYYDDKLKDIEKDKLSNIATKISTEATPPVVEESATNILNEVIAVEHPSDFKDTTPKERDYVDYTRYCVTDGHEGQKFEHVGPNGIFLISIEDYMQKNGYHKLVVNYYSDDDILTDDDGNVLDVNVCLGDSPVRDRTADIDRDDCYVRNMNTQTDYEIFYIDGSYSEEKLGM